MTNEDHNKYIAFSFIGHGVFQLLMGGFIGLMVTLMIQFDDRGAQPPPAFFYAFFGMMFFIQAMFAAPAFVAAYALLKRKPWARVASIVAAALSAMSMPVGTAAAVYSLWFFCGDQWKSVYPDVAAKGREEFPKLSHPESGWEAFTKDEEGAYVHRTPPPPDWR